MLATIIWLSATHWSVSKTYSKSIIKSKFYCLATTLQWKWLPSVTKIPSTSTYSSVKRLHPKTPSKVPLMTFNRHNSSLQMLLSRNKVSQLSEIYRERLPNLWMRDSQTWCRTIAISAALATQRRKVFSCPSSLKGTNRKLAAVSQYWKKEFVKRTNKMIWMIERTLDR